MADLFADENFPAPVVHRLKGFGHDVATVQEVGMRGEPDDRVLEYAATHNRAVLTCNRSDFIRLHAVVKNHAGIIVCTNHDADILTQKIDQVLINNPDLKNKLIRINKSP